LGSNTTISDFIKKPPVVFPLVALFHLVCLAMALVSLARFPTGTAVRINALWLAGYTLFWLAATAMRRWGAWGYLLLTIVNIMLFYSLTNSSDKNTFVSSLFLLDILFAFFLLLHYKKLR
jgi:hypothetical protein